MLHGDLEVDVIQALSPLDGCIYSRDLFGAFSSVKDLIKFLVEIFGALFVGLQLFCEGV